MRVFCPTCSEPINIGDELAGKTTSCPLCQANFTAPPLFSSSSVGAPAPTPPAPAPAPMPAPPPPAPAPVPMQPNRPIAVAPPVEPPAERPSHYGRTFGFSISPEIIQWAAPICLGLCVLLTFFSWNGAFPGGHAVYTQGPWRAMVGSISIDNRGEQVLKMNPTNPPEGQPRLKDQVSGNLLMLLYIPLLLGTFALAVFFTLLRTLPVRVPANLMSLVPYRMLLVAALGIVISLMLLYQAARGFGLQNALETRALAEAKQQLGEYPTDDTIVAREIEEGMLLGKWNVRQTTALHLVFLLQIVAVLAAAASFVMMRRTDKPAPRIEVMW